MHIVKIEKSKTVSLIIIVFDTLMSKCERQANFILNVFLKKRCVTVDVRYLVRK